MKAIILAGGRGTRLAPLTDTLPKPLVPVLNYPIMGYVIAALRDAGLEQIGIAAGTHRDLFQTYFGNGDEMGAHLTYLEDELPLGTAGSLRAHIEFFDRQPVLVVPADKISGVDLRALLAHHRSNPAAVTLAVFTVNRKTWTGDVVDAEESRGIDYHYLPGPLDAGDCLGSTDAWIVDPIVLQTLPASCKIDFPESVLSTLTKRGYSLGVYNAGHIRLRDFGVFPGFREGNIEALYGLHGITAQGIEVEPGVYVEDGVRLGEQVALTGPVCIGNNVVIGADARVVGPSLVGHDAVVGRGAAILRTVVLPGSVVPDGILIADGVVCSRESLLSSTIKYQFPFRNVIDRLADLR